MSTEVEVQKAIEDTVASTVEALVEAHVTPSESSKEPQATPINDGKKKKKEGEHKQPLHRTITSKNLQRFEERDLRAAIEFLLEKKVIPRNLDLGSVKKMNKEQLIKYAPTWALANVYEEAFKCHQARKNSTPVLDESQNKIYQKLSTYSINSISQALKDLNVPIKGKYNMKKDDLIMSVVLSKNASDIAQAARSIEKNLKRKREKARLEKELEKKKNSEDSDESEEEAPKKKKK